MGLRGAVMCSAVCACAICAGFQCILVCSRPIASLLLTICALPFASAHTALPPKNYNSHIILSINPADWGSWEL
ncbi:hypothetical protein XELAEV_18026200mg [Xenopus laevis]|uniref:Uncharacterized protein n=1 Tax=Xenopus laevis TaxID=8355 RepID=A0A974CV93_XENLA|nr:hypothetical protein XELAEV_18026200mg [Xenopus laevis]